MKRILFLVTTCGLLFALLYYSVIDQTSDISESKDDILISDNTSTNVTTLSEEQASVTTIPEGISKIEEASEFLSLVIGDQFRLAGQNDSSNRNLDIIVDRLNEQVKYTQIHGNIVGGGIAIITVGGGSTNIFLKTDTGIFEFAGQDFDGKVPRLKDVNWGDDIYKQPLPKALPPDEPSLGVRLVEP